jgi:hypothetical protein
MEIRGDSALGCCAYTSTAQVPLWYNVKVISIFVSMQGVIEEAILQNYSF